MRQQRQISGWGRWPIVDAEVIRPRELASIRAAMAAGQLAVRGAGRSYGDSSLGSRVIDMTGLARLRSFDRTTGIVCVDAGVTIDELLRVFGPEGWFPAVTPGTRHVTVGGALASDVHGKNHHVSGSFADHVLAFEMLLADGEVITVSPEHHPDLFQATAGGMGLTGVILSVTLRLMRVSSNRIIQRSLKLPNLDASLAAIAEHASATYSAAWVDCQTRGSALGRSLLLLGEHAAAGSCSPMIPGRAPVPVPFELPSRTLSRPVVSAFNALHYARQRSPSLTAEIPCTAFFYPLDVATDWNRLYGRRGFLQHQFVSPVAAGSEPLARALRLIADSGVPAPLAVLKAFGPGNRNPLSFPFEGYTLAVDFPASRSALALLDRLDELVLSFEGRIYLSKDARMKPETFRASYPRWEEFEQVRARYGANDRFVTLQSRRLGLG
jgi:decaprenylphospho-beta-D-ribofuranose 2-oxidase